MTMTTTVSCYSPVHLSRRLTTMKEEQLQAQQRRSATNEDDDDTVTNVSFSTASTTTTTTTTSRRSFGAHLVESSSLCFSFLTATLQLATTGGAANAYERRDVGGEDRSMITAAFNEQAFQTNNRLESQGFKLDTPAEEAQKLSDAMKSFSYDDMSTKKNKTQRKTATSTGSSSGSGSATATATTTLKR